MLSGQLSGSTALGGLSGGSALGTNVFSGFGATTPKPGTVLFNIGSTPVTQMHAAIGVGALALLFFAYKKMKK